MPTKRANVIREVVLALDEGRFRLSFHAQVQMAKRDILVSDLEEALYRAGREEQKDSLANDKKAWKYSLRGLNDNGDKDLRIIVLFDDPNVLIVTVIDKNKKED